MCIYHFPSSLPESRNLLAGKVFCLIGTLFVSRAVMTKNIVSLGGSVVNTVTKTCTHLLMSEDVAGTKICIGSYPLYNPNNP